MRSRLHVHGCLIPLLLLPAVAASCNGPDNPSSSQGPRDSATINEENYNKIVQYLGETQVEDILGYRNNEEVQIRGWPRTLGEIPGFENGFQIKLVIEEKQAGTCDVKPTEPVRWRKWTDPDVEGCCIAVCFFSEGAGGILSDWWVVAKRKGGF